MKTTIKKITTRSRVLEIISHIMPTQDLFCKYVILNQQSNIERELNMQANMKTKNGKNLKMKALVDSSCIHRNQ